MIGNHRSIDRSDTFPVRVNPIGDFSLWTDYIQAEIDLGCSREEVAKVYSLIQFIQCIIDQLVDRVFHAVGQQQGEESSANAAARTGSFHLLRYDHVRVI